jgi:DNA-binding transcriptional LysR family regulator
LNKITLELTEDEAWWLKQFCIDAAIVWHQNWQDVSDGKRPDLDADSCKVLNRRAHDYAERIQELLPPV